MRILLLGEFSALHKNLKDGLVELGHDVTVASAGDGWKRISSDINLGSGKKGLSGKVENFFLLLKAIPKFKNYDIVQFIAPVLFSRYLVINKFVTGYISSHNKKVFLVCAGAAPKISPIADFFEKNFKYPQLYKEIKRSSANMWSQTAEGREYNDWFLRQIDGLIPIMYEYSQGFRDIAYPKIRPTIPIPINIDETQYEDNVIEERLIIFHGLNREGEKGTPIIREAMKKLQRDYPNEVECIIDGKIPLNDYMDYLKRANIIIDQAYSVSIGMNGIYSLAMGKVVIGGGEQEFLDEFEIDKSPLIPIQPTVEDIYNQLERILKRRGDILEMGRASRRFAEQLHDYKKIAQRYVDVWQA